MTSPAFRFADQRRKIPGMPALETLVGREPEIRAIHELLDGIGERGASLVLRGEPGIGKSALLEEASRYAEGQGLTILATTAVESETRLPFAGLHQLLRPVLGDAERLPAPQRAALLGAFGMAEGGATDLFLIALGALELLSDQAAEAPLLLVVEDAHWLDEPTRDVITFLARRLDSEPIALLITTRDDGAADSKVTELSLEGLDEDASAELLDANAPDLAPEVRRRLLAEACGNPLALVELPKALDYEQLHGEQMLPEQLPLSARLEHAFAARVAELPPGARRVLLVAAAGGDATLDELLTAARATSDALESAEAAGLVSLDGERLRFHHPLVRSAVYQGASEAERRNVHSALAQELADHPDRSVWHRAAASAGQDAEVAAELRRAAGRARGRGAPTVEAAALYRAATLSPHDADRGALLLQAADVEFELGRLDRALQLLGEAMHLPLPPNERARLSFLVEMLEGRAWSGAEPLDSFVELALDLAEHEPERALHALDMVALRIWWAIPDRATRDRVVDAAERIPGPPDDAERLSVLAHADPISQGARVIRALASKPVRSDPRELFIDSLSASSLWAPELSFPLSEAAVDGLRAQGRLGVLAQALTVQAWNAVHLAREAVALAAAEEAFALATETRQPRWAVVARLVRAAILAERGDLQESDEILVDAERQLMASGANPLLAFVQFVRGRGAVAHGRPEEGLDQLKRIFDPADAAYQPHVGALSLADIVEASVQTGDRDGARAYLARLEEIASKVPAGLLQAQLAYGRALVADDEVAHDVFQEGLASGIAEWPCYRGRLLLAYGTWLRRHRRVAESRAPLRAARELFDALRFRGVAERARQELRASGETSRRRTPDAWDQLSPQELQIARMAAEGLTNREIGQKLYLSHRTVGSHLYRMFPKLGITSRAQLATALQSSD
jgi:DNA-binding CsgD family transcriptional regulator